MVYRVPGRGCLMCAITGRELARDQPTRVGPAGGSDLASRRVPQQATGPKMTRRSELPGFSVGEVL